MVDDPLQVLGAAHADGAPPGGLPPGAYQGDLLVGIVDGAGPRPLDGGFTSAPQFFQGLDDVRDDVTGPLQQNVVAQSQVLFTNEVLIVQTHAADHDAGQGDRLGLGHGGDGPDLANLVFHVQQAGRGLAGGEFVGDRPAGVMAGVAGPLLQFELVHLHDHAVDLVGIFFPPILPLCAEVRGPDDIGRLAALPAHLRHLKAQLTQHVQRPRMGAQSLHGILTLRVGPVAKAVDEGFQLALGGLGGGLHPQAPGGGIARVSEKRQAGGGPVGVDLGKAVLTDDHFPPELDPLETELTEFSRQRDGADHAGIVGDLLAQHAVTPSGGPHQFIIFVDQGDGSPVELRLHGVGQRGRLVHVQHPLHLPVELRQIFGIVAVAQAEHGREMGHGLKITREIAAYPLARAVGGYQVGVFFLQIEEHPVEPVVFGIREQGIVLHVVAPLVEAEEGA